MVISLKRSGSTFVASLLNSHFQIMCFPFEVLHPQGVLKTAGLSDYEAVNCIHNMRGYRATGMKLIWGQHLLVPEMYWRTREVKCIRVVRRSHVAAIISEKTALATRCWHSLDPPPLSTMVFNATVRERKQREEDEAAMEEWLAKLGMPTMTIVYENVLPHLRVVDGITYLDRSISEEWLTFLDSDHILTSEPLKTELKRISPRLPQSTAPSHA